VALQVRAQKLQLNRNAKTRSLTYLRAFFQNK
jgi:hypothetical protein